MSAASQPLVSVIIPVYNAGAYLRPAVDSILGQTYRNLEILIYDDGSTDGCMDALADLKDDRVRIVRQANAGKSVVMNRALDSIRGEFYLIQDADDISYPRRIERQMDCLLANPDVAAVFCGHRVLLGSRAMAPIFVAKSREDCRASIDDFAMPAHDPTGIYRWSMVRELRYEPELRITHGVDYILQVGEQHAILVLGECLYTYRVHSTSLTTNVARRTQEIGEVHRRALARRKLAAAAPDLTGRNRNLSRNTAADNSLYSHFMESVLDQRRAGAFFPALKTALQCLSLHPMDRFYYKPLVYSLVPLGLIQAYRRRRRRAQGGLGTSA